MNHYYLILYLPLNIILNSYIKMELAPMFQLTRQTHSYLHQLKPWKEAELPFKSLMRGLWEKNGPHHVGAVL